MNYVSEVLDSMSVSLEENNVETFISLSKEIDDFDTCVDPETFAPIRVSGYIKQLDSIFLSDFIERYKLFGSFGDDIFYYVDDKMNDLASHIHLEIFYHSASYDPSIKGESIKAKKELIKEVYKTTKKLIKLGKELAEQD